MKYNSPSVYVLFLFLFPDHKAVTLQKRDWSAAVMFKEQH